MKLVLITPILLLSLIAARVRRRLFKAAGRDFPNNLSGLADELTKKYQSPIKDRKAKLFKREATSTYYFDCTSASVLPVMTCMFVCLPVFYVSMSVS